MTFGPGTDAVVVRSGSVLGDINQEDGADSFLITGGTVSGAVHQGNGIDTFIMTGGSINSLSQGDNHDTFFMTGGTIVGAFEDGDEATMTGGSIGRVDMKLDNNIFDMSGGEILGNLVTGFGLDTITISDGYIGGNISVSGGDDVITISGGTVVGEVRASTGNDTLTWLNGGEIQSAVLMGEGDDKVLLSGLDESILSATPKIDGDVGADQLTLTGTTSARPERYINWETIALTDSSRLDLAGKLVLGDSVSNTGALSVSADSSLMVNQGVVAPSTSGALVDFNNAGTIDLANTGSGTNTLTVFGNYVGNNGLIKLNSTLGDDASASDKLVVSNGSISGRTELAVSNLGGQGGLTLVDGIQVVQAINSATSTNDAFTLRGSLSAGAYQYYLFKGGVTAGTNNNWYLRSTVVALPKPPVTPPVIPPVTPPVTPVGPPLTPTPAPGTPSLPVAKPGEVPIPIYRVEVPVYSSVIPSAQLLAMHAVGTFHDRQGDQNLLLENGVVVAGWGRGYGTDFRQSWSGAASPSFDGTSKGYQVGHDLYALENEEGNRQHYGLFLGKSRLKGDVEGFAEGFMDRKSGRTKLDGESIGFYASFTNPKGSYLDLVAMATDIDGDTRSERGVRLKAEGDVLTFSGEAGHPLKISDNWVVEPQVQIINQQVDLDRQHDGISEVSFDSQDYWMGRLGARVKGHYINGRIVHEPYARANVWRTFNGKDTVTYDAIDRLKTEHDATTADVELGVITRLSSVVSVHMSVDYNTNLDGDNMEGVGANLGLRVSW